MKIIAADRGGKSNHVQRCAWLGTYRMTRKPMPGKSLKEASTVLKEALFFLFSLASVRLQVPSHGCRAWTAKSNCY
jgi:hypothetical protein